MKKFSLIILAILIASPLSSLIGIIYGYFSMNESLREEQLKYSSPFSNFILVAIGSIPIYIIIGIPVTLIIDLLTKKTGVTTTYKVYFMQLFLYSFSAIGLSSILVSNELGAYGFILLFVLTYFHVLFYLRLRYLK